MYRTARPRRRLTALRLRLLAALALGAAAAPALAQNPPVRPISRAHDLTAGAAGGVPVLTWHGFADEPIPGLGNLTESFPRFEEMLRFLEENGFRSVFPEQVRPAEIARRKQVILTFDDGRKEQLRAAEMLERHGFRGIFFVIPNRTRADDPRFLSPEDVAKLVRAGHRVAAHGYDHRSLPGSGTEVAASLVRSAAMLAAHAGEARPAPDFAFPFGHYTAEVAEALAGGYRYLHTVNPGYWDGASPFVPRMLIMRDVDPALFREYLLGGARYAPVLEPLTPDGAVAGQVAFLARGRPVPEGVELFAISSDAEGRSYASHPLAENLRVSGDTVIIDLAAHLRRHFPPNRNVVSYALVTRDGQGFRYLTPGLLHWVFDPAVPRTLPAPPPPDTTGAAPRPQAPNCLQRSPRTRASSMRIDI